MTMTDTEAKALALVNEFRAKCAEPTLPVTMSHVWAYGAAWEALCRAIEREEAAEARHAAEMRELKERFSEAAAKVDTILAKRGTLRDNPLRQALAPFIIPAPDPLVGVAEDAIVGCTHETAKRLKGIIEARGGKIVWEAGDER